MGLKILYFMVTALIFSRLTQQLATTPEERCQSDGSSVCIDCFRKGSCKQDPDDGSYTVIYDDTCPTVEGLSIYCDDSLYTTTTGPYGNCVPVGGSLTNCTCTSITKCIADPNNPNAVLHCESSPPVTDPSCLANSVIDLSTCGCKTCSETCQFLDDPNDDCESYFVCSGADELIPVSCLEGTCFNQDSCKCEDSPTPPTTCPSDCIFVDDPDDPCQSFFYCSGTELIPISCSANSCFNQTTCGCEELKCPTGCPFVDDPYGDCGSFYYCDGDDLTPVSCPDSFCFDQDACNCIEREGSSTTSTTTTEAPLTISPPPLTCPDGCPFVDNPDDKCTKFYICNGNTLTPAECPGTLCFNQGLCQCVG